MRLVLALASIALLAGCGKGDNAPAPGGVTAGEARALDDAARMLDERQMPAEALATSPTAASSAAAPR